MSVFAILTPTANPPLSFQISQIYPDHLEVSDRSWLIFTEDTSLGVSRKLGVSERNEQGAVTSQFGHILVIQVSSSYWGYGSTSTWEWLKSALERSA